MVSLRPHRCRALVTSLRAAEAELARIADPAVRVSSEEIHAAIAGARGALAGVAEVLEEHQEDACPT
jgi:hypothetical protein